MDNTSFSFRDGLMVLGLVALAFLTFFSCLYLTRGNEITSGIITALCVVIFFALSYFLTLYKRRVNNGKISLAEIILLFGYCMIALATLPILLHFVNIEFVKKDEIQTEGLKRVAYIDDMFVEYGKQTNSYIQNMTTALDNAKVAYQNSGSSSSRRDRNMLNPAFEDYGIDIEDINTLSQAGDRAKSTIIARENGFKNGLENLTNEKNDFTERQRNIFQNWNRLRLNRSLQVDLDSMTQLYQTELSSKFGGFAFPPEDADPDKYKRTELDLTNPFVGLRTTGTNWILSILVILIIHVLILAPFLFFKRQGLDKKYNTGYQTRGEEIT